MDKLESYVAPAVMIVEVKAENGILTNSKDQYESTAW